MAHVFVKELKEIRKEDVETAGGKGANLGEMIHGELPVPGGFVLLTEAYRHFVHTNGLEEKISRQLQESDLITQQSLDQAARTIEAWFMESPLPAEILNAVDAMYQALGQPVVAVRSSATAEDLPGMSFAGQYSTILNIQGRDALMRAIRECWASLWNRRALSYRKKHAASNEGLAHGVVIQQLVPAEKSGILFTANPVNGRRDQILLNASWGLGEAIVGGDVTPDQWVVEKPSGRMVEKTIANKNVMTRREASGIRHVPMPEELQQKETLSDEEVSTLLQLALDTETYFGSPQDLEWAYADGAFYLVQARPITSLFHLPEQKPGRDGLRIYMNMNNYSQAMKEPFTPMGAQLIEDMARDIVRRMGKKDPRDPETLWFLQNLGGRIFIDMTEVLRNPKTWRKFENNPNDKDPVTSLAMLQFLRREREAVTSRKGANFFKALNRKTLAYGIGAIKKINTGRRSADLGRKRAIQHGEEMVRHLKDQAKNLKSLEDRILFIETSIADLFLKGFEIIFFVSASSTYLEKARKLMASCLNDLSDLPAVEKAVPHSVTTEMGMAILKMAEALDAQGRRATPGCDEIKAFLVRYGHRNTIELDVGVPSWKEEPQYVLNLVNTYIDNQNYREGLRRFQKDQQEAEAAILRIRRKMEGGGAGKARKVEKLLRDFRAMFGIRELSKFYLRHGLTIYRDVLLQGGTELVDEGRLEKAEDIFFTSFPDLRAGRDLKELVTKNREQYRMEMNRKAPRVLTSTGESLYAAVTEAGENALAGIPVSPGVHEGVVRVLDHPEEGDRLEVGDILVTTGTNPAWTPLFLKLGGLVMETGGPISHGSVVAREYGLPAVAGVAEATSLLRDGQRIRINGESGLVELLAENKTACGGMQVIVSKE